MEFHFQEPRQSNKCKRLAFFILIAFIIGFVGILLIVFTRSTDEIVTSENATIVWNIIDYEPPVILGQSPPTIYFEDHENNGFISILCNASGKPAPRIDWYFNAKLISETNFHQLVLHNSKSLEYHIDEPEKSDAGSYHCCAWNKWGKACSRPTQAVLAELNLDDFMYTDNIIKEVKNYRPKMNHPLIIPVHDMMSSPPANFVWKKNSVGTITASERIWIDSQGSLHFGAIEASDNGTYTCVAKNKFLNKTIGCALATVFVNNLEKPKFLNQLKSARIAVGQRHTVRCNATGYPQPAIIWTLNESRDFPDNVEIKDNVLEIEKANLTNSMSIQCRAVNAYGTISQHAFVNVTPRNTTNVKWTISDSKQTE